MNVTNTPDHLLTRRKLRKNLKKFLLSLLQAIGSIYRNDTSESLSKCCTNYCLIAAELEELFVISMQDLDIFLNFLLFIMIIFK